MEEIWKDITGYKGLYQISNLGRVKSLCFGARNIRKSNIHRLLKLRQTNCGYSKVELYKDGKSQIKYVHRLVAEAFIPNPNHKSQVNHIDGCKTNNNITNLEWTTASENQQHAISIGIHAPSPMKNRKGNLCPKCRPITQHTLEGQYIRKWDSILEASNHYGINPSCISNCLSGRVHSSYGYIWKYAES